MNQTPTEILWNKPQELPQHGRVMALLGKPTEFVFDYFDGINKMWVAIDGTAVTPDFWRYGTLPAPKADEQIESVPGGFAAQVIDTVRARGNSYGSPAENHQLTADMLSAFLRRRFKLTPEQLTFSAEDVCTLNIIQKISRLANVSKDDSWLDIAGYTENVAMIRPDQRNFRVESKKLGHGATIIVNGKRHKLDHDATQIGYEALLNLACMSGKPAKVELTSRDGNIYNVKPGEHVVVTNGDIVVVA